ncbi:TIR domain-containing protein [Catellatospora methionotrophica]|uniref:TIR domain-containing protein n=1 Tax=Catellatospora methionotrophica TaxID=121620 RepID=UPI0033EA58C6
MPGKPSAYDVFLSLSGTDRGAVEPIVKALRGLGLEVFYDMDGIDESEGITAAIQQALHGARALVAYYSAAYPMRYACQFELTSAMLAAESRGGPQGRIIVINPEEHEEHLRPAMIADLKFARYRHGTDKPQELARLIERQVRTLDGPLGDVDVALPRPRWFAERVMGKADFVGRYVEQWDLHSLLEAGRFPLTQEALRGPAVLLAGVGGSGKTALVAAYAWQFSAAHAGGVHWLSLAGATATDAPERYLAQVRIMAETLGLPTSGLSRAELFGAVAEILHRRPAPSLWVVDDVPSDLDPRELHRMLLPAGDAVRTVLIIDAADYTAGDLPMLRLTGLSAEDAARLLERYRTASGVAETAARDTLVRLLDGHAWALTQAGLHLRDRVGIRGYADLAADPGGHRDVWAEAAGRLRQSITDAGGAAEWIIAVASAGAPGHLPAGVVIHTMRSLARLHGHSGVEVERSLVDLGARMLLTRVEGSWRTPSMVLTATADSAPASAHPQEVREALAEAVLSHQPTNTREQQQLNELAERLAEAVPARLRARLLRMLAIDADRRGDASAAARSWLRLVDVATIGSAELVAAAAAAHHAGSHEDALRLAEGAVRDPDPVTAVRAQVVRAQAGLALGHLDEVKRWWRQLGAHSVPPAEQSRVSAARVQWLVASGRFAAASELLERTVRQLEGHREQDRPGVVDELSELRLQQAHIWLGTDRQRAARATAAEVYEDYARRDLPHHRLAIRARILFAEALLTPQFSELSALRTPRRDAVAQLQAQAEQFRTEYGPGNILTLAAAISHAQGQVATGAAEAALRTLPQAVKDLEAVVGPDHSLYLRAAFLMGQAYTQLGMHAESRHWCEVAYAGQLLLLGAAHPHTLYSQYQLAVELKFLGQGEAAEMFADVRRLARHSVGRTTDLAAMANIAVVLDKLPRPIWQLFDHSQHWRRRR